MKCSPSRCALAVVLISACCLSAVELKPFGSPLDAEIVAAYIPPTRSDDPVVATAHHAYLWDADNSSWRPVYSPPWASAQILAVKGYEKSSQAIYIAHTSGIGRSGDKGNSWIEAVPTGFDIEEGPAFIRVNPSERQHAVVSRGNLIWETVDYGSTYRGLDLPGGFDTILEMAFLPGPDTDPSLLVVFKSGIGLYEGSSLKLVRLWNSRQKLARAIIQPDGKTVLLQADSGGWLAFSLLVPNVPGIRQLPGHIEAGLFAANLAGPGSLWTVDKGEVRIETVLQKDLDPFVLADLPGPVSILVTHPRAEDGLYLATGKQLYRLNNGFQGLGEAYLEPMQVRGLQKADWEPVANKTPPSVPIAGEQPMDAAIVIAQTLAGEPSFRQAVQMALEHEQAKPGAFLEWHKKIRRRHLFPTLKLQGGFREYGVDDNIIITNVDEFGFEKREDYRLPDRLRNLGFFGLTLEWPLEELVFDDEIVDISRERRYYFKDRRRLIDTMAELYYQRIDRIIEAKGFRGQPSQSKLIQLLLEINQLSEILNGYCAQELFNPMPVR